MGLLATCHSVERICALDSSATHSFVHPCVVSLISVATSKGAKLSITVANGSKVVCDDVVKSGLVFMVQGYKTCQVTTMVKLYMLDGLLTNSILGMDYLQWHNP